MIEFLKLHACLVRIKGHHALTCARAAIAAHNNSTVAIVARQRTSIRFKLAVRGDTGAGGLVASLSCTAYFGKLAVLFGCSLQSICTRITA